MSGYTIIARNNRKPFVKNTLQVQHTLVGLLLAVGAFYAPGFGNRLWLGIAAIITLLLVLFYKKLSHYGLLQWIVAGLQIAIILIFLQSIPIAIFVLVGILTLGLFKDHIDIHFTAEGVNYRPYLLRKKHAWSELQNVIIKDGLLTMDFTNNKIVQMNVDDAETDVKEETFNAYCKEKLKVKG
jgi:membrane-bound ClpP family serine protease